MVEGLCAECRSGDEVCQIANILFPNGFSCAGSKAAMDKLLEKANKTDGCLQAPKRNLVAQRFSLMRVFWAWGRSSSLRMEKEAGLSLQP